MSTAFCVCCDHAVRVGSNFTRGQIITCAHCGTLLEVLALDPPELDWAYLEHAMDEEIGEGEGEEKGEWEWAWADD